eukprot:1316597-Prymnesium_polylepis.1
MSSTPAASGPVRPSKSFGRFQSTRGATHSPNQGSESRDSLSPIFMLLGPPAPFWSELKY